MNQFLFLGVQSTELNILMIFLILVGVFISDQYHKRKRKRALNNDKSSVNIPKKCRQLLNHIINRNRKTPSHITRLFALGFIILCIAFPIFHINRIDSVKKESYNEGYRLGKNQGYEEGREAGYSEGYDDGVSEGYKRGYNNVYNQKHNRTMPCIHCSGRGVVACFHCDGQGCFFCDNTGLEACSICDGKGSN